MLENLKIANVYDVDFSKLPTEVKKEMAGVYASTLFAANVKMRKALPLDKKEEIKEALSDMIIVISRMCALFDWKFSEIDELAQTRFAEIIKQQDEKRKQLWQELGISEPPMTPGGEQ